MARPKGAYDARAALFWCEEMSIAGTRKIRALIDPNTAELWTGPISGFRHAPNVAALRRPAA